MKKLFISGVIGIISGGVGGYLLGYKLAKKKYEKLADEEVESVKKVLEQKYAKISEMKKEINSVYGNVSKKTENEIPQKKEPFTKEEKTKYVDYSAMYRTSNGDSRIVGNPENKKEKENSTENAPYVITPDEYADSNYETKTLYYYTDCVLADEDNNIIYNVEEHVGNDSLNKFGLYEDDVVYVKNDNLLIIYEILLDERAYKNVASFRGKRLGNDSVEE